ncbi:MAG: hypothetical protein QG657_2121 [Acidobacteriota bacterium]|nr:hypothetical protein [Acidobacteriota bacterium]
MKHEIRNKFKIQIFKIQNRNMPTEHTEHTEFFNRAPAPRAFGFRIYNSLFHVYKLFLYKGLAFSANKLYNITLSDVSAERCPSG